MNNILLAGCFFFFCSWGHHHHHHYHHHYGHHYGHHYNWRHLPKQEEKTEAPKREERQRGQNNVECENVKSFLAKNPLTNYDDFVNQYPANQQESVRRCVSGVK